jgi:hypothetical protein
MIKEVECCPTSRKNSYFPIACHSCIAKAIIALDFLGKKRLAS